LEPERLFASIDKLLIFTIWEAGSRSVIFDEKASVFSGFQMSLDVVEAKNNQFLASSPVFGSSRNDFDKNEFDRGSVPPSFLFHYEESECHFRDIISAYPGKVDTGCVIAERLCPLIQ